MTQPADRNRANLEAILQALLPELIYLGVHEYNVVSVSDGPPVKIDARSTDPRLPDLVGIVLRPDSTGGRASPTPGASILIGFIGGNAQRPYVHSLDPTSVPSNVHIGALTLIELGNSLALALAHAPNTSTSLTAIITWLTAFNVWANATIIAFGGVFTDPGGTNTATLVAATTAAISAITAQLPTLATTIVKGT